MVPGGSSGGSAAATPQHILFGRDYPYVKKTDSSLDELSRARLSAIALQSNAKTRSGCCPGLKRDNFSLDQRGLRPMKLGFLFIGVRQR